MAVVDGRELYEVQKAAGLVYKAGLRAELTGRLGVAWTAVDRNGVAEIVGVPARLIEEFSKRRHDVEREGNRLVADREATLGRSLTAVGAGGVFSAGRLSDPGRQGRRPTPHRRVAGPVAGRGDQCRRRPRGVAVRCRQTAADGPGRGGTA